MPYPSPADEGSGLVVLALLILAACAPALVLVAAIVWLGGLA